MEMNVVERWKRNYERRLKANPEMRRSIPEHLTRKHTKETQKKVLQPGNTPLQRNRYYPPLKTKYETPEIQQHTKNPPQYLTRRHQQIERHQKINTEALEIREGYKHIAKKELQEEFPNGLNKSHSKADKLKYYFLIYNSDKFQQHYHISYAKYLPKAVSNFLEIGTWQGGGILAFKKWYNSQGSFFTLNHVFGIDGITTIQAMIDKGINCFEGSQSDLKFLKTIKDKFDVITEDGSHHSDEQIITFKHMFKHNLKKGGLYIIEDMYCCNESYWWRRIIKSFNDTMLGVVDLLISGFAFSRLS